MGELDGYKFISVPRTIFSPLIACGRNGDVVCGEGLSFLLATKNRCDGLHRYSRLESVWTAKGTCTPQRHCAMSVPLRVKATLKACQHFLSLVLSQLAQTFGW